MKDKDQFLIMLNLFLKNIAFAFLLFGLGYITGHTVALDSFFCKLGF